MNTDTTHTPTPATGQTPEQAERLRAIAEKQGTLGTSRVENLLGAGAGLWETDAQFEQFLEHLREIRHDRG